MSGLLETLQYYPLLDECHKTYIASNDLASVKETESKTKNLIIHKITKSDHKTILLSQELRKKITEELK